MPEAGFEQPVAPQERRELGPQERLNRAWLWANTAQWNRSEEAKSKPDLWAVFSTPISRRRAVARSFASAMADQDGVRGLWVTDLQGDLDVAIALGDLDLEPQIRETFIDLVCAELDPSEGELFVFPSNEVPDWVQSGESLI